MTGETLLLTVGVLTVAGFVQGLTGFGFGLVAMGLLPLVLDYREAQAIVTLTGLVCCGTMAFGTWRSAQWSGAVHLWLGTIIGVPLGFWGLSLLPQPLVMRLLGVTICALVLFELVIARLWSVQLPHWSGWCFGLVGGAIGGAFNIGGPVLVAYIFGRPWTKQQQVATLSAVFFSNGLLRMALLLSSQQLHENTWASAAWAIGPMTLAIVCGNRLLRYVQHSHLRAGVFATLLVLGVHYIWISS